MAKVYAFNRPSRNVVQRQMDAFVKHGVLEDCLRSPKYCLVEGDLTKPFFGLEEKVFEEVTDLMRSMLDGMIDLLLFSRSVVDPGFSNSYYP